MPSGLPPSRPTFLASLRSTLRSAEYRAERRQLGLAKPIALAAVGTLGLALPMHLTLYDVPEHLAAAPFLLWLVVVSMPGTLIGGSIRRERASGLMEDVLLTPADRAVRLWAKVLANLRPVLWPVLACPCAGALIGAFLDRSLSSALWGLLGGGALGIVSLGEALLISAIDLRSSLRCRGWLTAMLISGASWIAVHACEAVILLVLFGMAAALYPLSPALAVALGAVAVLGRMLIVNVLLPDMLVAHCAAQFDRLALRHIAAKEG